MVNFKWTKREILWSTAMTVLCIICFPVNPLVLTRVKENKLLPRIVYCRWDFCDIHHDPFMVSALVICRTGSDRSSAFLSKCQGGR